MIMGCSRKFESRAVLSVSFIWFLLLVVSLADMNHIGRDINTITIPSSTTNVKISKPIGTADKRNLDYVVSKRRVPNGPDPIHNRRVGDSKLPPT